MGDQPVCELPTRINCDNEGRGRGREEGGGEKKEREGGGGKREERGRKREGEEGRRGREGEGGEGKEREGRGRENMVVHALLSIDLTLTFGSHSKIV